MTMTTFKIPYLFLKFFFSMMSSRHKIFPTLILKTITPATQNAKKCSLTRCPTPFQMPDEIRLAPFLKQILAPAQTLSPLFPGVTCPQHRLTEKHR